MKKVQLSAKVPPETLEMLDALVEHFSNEIQKAEKGAIIYKAISDAYQLYVLKDGDTAKPKTFVGGILL